MDSQVTLVTSDDPPVKLSVSRAALLTNSRVFADLLSLPGAVETEIPLSETAEELQLFIKIVTGGELDALRKQSEEALETLAKLGDKYNSAVVKGFVSAHAWKISRLQNAPFHVFTLASYCSDDQHLLRKAALLVMVSSPKEGVPFGASEAAKTRLALYRQRIRASALETLANTPFTASEACTPGFSSCSQGKAYECYNAASCKAVKKYHGSGPFYRQSLFIAQYCLCSRHYHEVVEHGRMLDVKFRAEEPAFPA